MINKIKVLIDLYAKITLGVLFAAAFYISVLWGLDAQISVRILWQILIVSAVCTIPILMFPTDGERELSKNGMLIRRIIAGIFMLALNIFFFYYTIVFCGIYVNTQYGWFYSGIWSLFWVWICFAPLYIVIISAVENAGSEICAYYMKRLFIF